jgi:hypothetical protein
MNQYIFRVSHNKNACIALWLIVLLIKSYHDHRTWGKKAEIRVEV